MNRLITILLLLISCAVSAQLVTPRVNHITVVPGSAPVPDSKIYNVGGQLYWNGYRLNTWRDSSSSHIAPYPLNRKIYYPGMPSAAGQTLPGYYTTVYYNRLNHEFTTFLTNSGGGAIVDIDDTLTGCQNAYNYSKNGQEVTITIDSIYNVCGCFTFVNSGVGTTVYLTSVEGLTIGGSATYTVTSGSQVLVCPDSTEFNALGEIDPIYAADSAGITYRIGLRRLISNHDSLSRLDERNYESLTSKPVLTVTQDLPYSSVITLDSSDIILTTEQYNTLRQIGNEILIGTDTSNIITRYDTALFATYTETVVRDTLVKRYTRDRFRTMSNHDSLSTLDERSYNSLTDKPIALSGTVTQVTATTPLQATGTNSVVVAIKADSLSSWYTKMNQWKNDSVNYAKKTYVVTRDSLVQQYARTRDALKVSKADSNINGSYTSKKYVDGLILTKLTIGDTANLATLTEVNTRDTLVKQYTRGRFRTMSNHDSLSKLDERSYESLTSKPTLTINSDLPYSAVITLDSSDVIMTADSGLSMALVGNEAVFKNTKRTLASLDERAYSSLTGQPQAMTPTAHTQTWSTITSVPSTYTPTAHSQEWSTITSVPSTYTPSTHTHNYESLTSKPVLTVTQDLPYSSVISLDSSDVVITADSGLSLTQTGNELVLKNTVTRFNSLLGLPASYTPTAHTQAWSTITGVPGSYTPTSHTQDWTTILNPPATYTPTAHTQAISTITALQDSLNVKLYGSGTANTIPKFENGKKLGNSLLTDNGTTVSYYKTNNNPNEPSGISITVKSSSPNYQTTYPVLDFYAATPLLSGRIASTFYGGSGTDGGFKFYTPNSGYTLVERMTINGNGFYLPTLAESTDATQVLTWDATDGSVKHQDIPIPVPYPDPGIAVSTGSSWGTSITNNSANWNTSYGWGNHASAGYLTTSPTLAAGTGITITGTYPAVQTITATGVPYTGATADVNLGTHTITTAQVVSDNFKITPEGGYAVKMVAGCDLSAGSVVEMSTISNTVTITSYDYSNAIGVVYSTVTSGNPVWIVVSGIVKVYFNEDGDAPTPQIGHIAYTGPLPVNVDYQNGAVCSTQSVYGKNILGTIISTPVNFEANVLINIKRTVDP